MTTPFEASKGRSAASKFGQMIGEAFEKIVFDHIQRYLAAQHPDYQIAQAGSGSKTTLELVGGLARQMDTIITPKNSDDPVALLETKWLKDARHHNDKGA